MLLGSPSNSTSTHTDNSPAIETLILQLILQQRYAEVYQLLLSQQSASTSALYNMALCLHWAGNYQQALSRLDRIQLPPQVSMTNQANADTDYNAMKNKQNYTDDHLQGITETFILTFPSFIHDAIVRLKTDCWLQLGNYGKVIAVATPLAHKGYKNITDALDLANKAIDKNP